MVAFAKSPSQVLARSLEMSSRLTASFYHMYRPGATMYVPEDIIPVLNKAKVRFLVMGTHGVGAWRSGARATRDVDFLIASRDHAKAVRAIQRAFPELELIEATVVTRFKDPTLGEVVIDLMKPNQPLFKVAFRNSIVIKTRKYRAPNLEFALASKFAAMVSHHRDEGKKHIDFGDFFDIVRHNFASINMEKLQRLANLVYPGGGAEVAKIVNDIMAGKKIIF